MVQGEQVAPVGGIVAHDVGTPAHVRVPGLQLVRQVRDLGRGEGGDFICEGEAGEAGGGLRVKVNQVKGGG